MTDLIEVYEAVVVVGIAGPLLALGGHGSIAWVAIRRFFGRTRDWVSSQIATVHDRMGKFESRVDELETSMLAEVREMIPPAPDLDGLKTSMLAEVAAKIAEADSAAQARLESWGESFAGKVGESVKMGMLSARAAEGRIEKGLELDVAEATDPTARALLKTLGRRKGGKLLEVLQAAREVDAQVHPELHPPPPNP